MRTDTQSTMSLTLQIPTADGTADAFAAFPDSGTPAPGVLMYPDAFGLRPVLENMARELAAHGYCVLVPNLYYRHAPTPVVELPAHIGEDERPAVFERVVPLVRTHSTDRVLRDASAYLDFLSARPEVSAGPVAAVGYCLGAVLAVRTAAAHPGRVAAVAGFHPGRLVSDAPDSPHRDAARMTAEVHLGIAEGDMKPEAIAELSRRLDSGGVVHRVEVHPGAVHGFTMADTDAFDAEALRLHWDRLLSLLDRNLTRTA
ncbi:dienelactone hydrolase family protein [Streptomyces beihaiensis]|uniref:Dienelactone hydrolase family protein n=1 Tax=Streptomyces beihaiensis TaxID=2984495 RepID=A0ABT3TW28_9ACTN|nr:dienelactone hydrolase family protein [Streptomyces beihaiensis]MCX3061239.1 dienelactone hydrolase family protein [Streptomyces beihaiensis]